MENFSFTNNTNDIDSVNLLVSPICNKDGKKYAFVSFTQGKKCAEGRIPECEIIRNEGFSDEEKAQLVTYMKDHLAELKSMSAGINIIENLYGKLGK